MSVRAGRKRKAAPTPAPTSPSIGPRMALEYPVEGSEIALGTPLHGHGWVLATGRATALSVTLDGVPLGTGITGLYRADLDALVASLPGAQPPGFSFEATIPSRPPGPARLRVVVTTEDGEVATEIGVLLQASAAPPPPDELAPLRVTVEQTWFTADETLHVRGWAVAWRGLARLELRQAGRVLGAGVAGLSRADVAAAVPEYPGAATAGFAFGVPASAALVGAGDLTLVAIDSAGETATAACALDAPDADEAPADIASPPGGDPPAAATPSGPLLGTLEDAWVDAQGLLYVRGWAVGHAPVRHVGVTVGTLDLGTAEPHQPRADVAAAYPYFATAARAGFLLRRPIDPALLPEAAVLTVSILAADGGRLELSAPLAVAAGARAAGPPLTELLLHVDSAELWSSGALHVEGWALCNAGIGVVEVALDDRPLGIAELGQDRLDVGNAYPQVQGSRRSGFRFTGDAPAGDDGGPPLEGEHTLRITARGHDGDARTLEQTVQATPGGPAEAPREGAAGLRYFLDLPVLRDGRATEPVRGFLSLAGWAFSDAGVTGIEVFLDGRALGQAYRGIRREDLHKHTGAEAALRAGFAMLVPPAALRRGEHEMRVVIRDAAGEQAEIAFALSVEPDLPGEGPWSLRCKITQAEADQARAIARAAGGPERIDLWLPLAAADPSALRATLASLRDQAWQDWRALLAPDAAAALPAGWDEELADFAGRIALADTAEPQEGAPLLLALPAGDTLGEDALQEFAVAAALEPDADFFYADERRPDPADGETRPHFKPDHSPELLFACNYIGRVWAARPSLLARAGLSPSELAQAGAYDAVLRLAEKAARVVHIPRVLSARGPAPAEPPAAETAALVAALARRGEAGAVGPGLAPQTWRVRRPVRFRGRVSVIMPTAGARDLVRTAIASLRATAGKRRLEIVAVDNIPPDHPRRAALRRFLAAEADAVLEVPEPFNWARFNNLAVDQARGEMLLFLNDDIEATAPGWLDALLAQAERREVGAVGPLLLYPDGKIQHAGQFLSGAIGRHAFRFSPADEPGPFGLALTERNVIAVTGACLLTRRDVFERVGRFDERHAVINNDLDYCLRVQEAGLRIVYTPHACLTHHEMASREALADVHDAAHFQGRWAERFALGDPYFSPHLSTQSDDYVPEREPVRAQHVGHPLIARARVRRILALKLDHIGDFVCAFPAFRRLKQHFPDAELTVLAARASLSLASLEPAIDRVLQFDFFHARSELGRRTFDAGELDALTAMLAPHRFDIAIDLRRQPDTREILKSTGARWLAGIDRAGTMPFLDVALEWEGDQAQTRKRQHVSEALVALVDTLAAACEPEATLAAALPAPDAAARPAALPATGPLVAVHAGAGAVNKTWPAAHFAGLIDLLAAREGAAVVIIGGPDEAPLAAAILAQLRHPAHTASLAGQVPLSALPGLLRGCDLYIGNDSGPKHIAAAIGIPTLGIHAGSVDATEWAPVGPEALALRRDMVCSPCYLALAADCHRGLACLHGITVADAYRAARRLLALRRGPAAAWVRGTMVQTVGDDDA